MSSDPEIVSLDGAFVSRFDQGPLRTDRGPVRWIRGAVYDGAGVLVPSSQREWNGDAQDPVAADPERVRVPPGAYRLRGQWLYAGHWCGHFGHFLLELLPNLWPDPSTQGPLAGVLVHHPARGPVARRRARFGLLRPDTTSWQREFIDLAGYGDHDLRVVNQRPVRVARLLVPSRPVLLKQWARPPAVDLWQRISGAVGRRGPHPRVYLSRTSFHADASDAARVRSDQDWDGLLDARFADAGFEVVHPETMPIAEQIELVRGAGVLAGLSGSAMHLSAFAEPGTRVLSIGDRRTPKKPPPSQRIIDEACGHRTAFVANNDEAGLAEVLSTLDH